MRRIAEVLGFKQEPRLPRELEAVVVAAREAAKIQDRASLSVALFKLSEALKRYDESISAGPANATGPAKATIRQLGLTI